MIAARSRQVSERATVGARMTVAAAGLAVIGGAVPLVRLVVGDLDEWEGTYTGLLRPSGQAWSVSVLAIAGDTANANLLLSAPNMRDGTCTIAFARHLRRMEVIGGQKCTGSVAGRTYAVDDSVASMDLDGDALSVKLDLTPGDGSGWLDWEHQVKIDFVGTRAPQSRFPAAPTASTPMAIVAYDAWSCDQQCLKCDVPCTSQSDLLQRALCVIACNRTSALCCHDIGLPSESASCGCAGAH